MPVKKSVRIRVICQPPEFDEISEIYNILNIKYKLVRFFCIAFYKTA